RSANFQEFSQRYSDPTKELEFCLREPRLQDKKNRQNSLENIPEEGVKDYWYLVQEKQIDSAIERYKGAIDLGIAKECARVILPEGNTVSRAYMNATVRTWIHYLQLRTKNGTQKEHKLVAMHCIDVLSYVFP